MIMLMRANEEKTMRLKRITDKEYHEIITMAAEAGAKHALQAIQEKDRYRAERKRAEQLEAYQARKEFVRSLLESYRNAPEHGQARKIVDSLILAYRELYDGSYLYQLHYNLIILRYIVKEALTDREICKRLGGIRKNVIRTGTDCAIRNMTILLFGVFGVDPEELKFVSIEAAE